MQDVQADNNILRPSRKYTHHKHIVNDVQYHPFNKNFIGSVSDDLTMQIVDVRRPETDKSALTAKDGHTDAINCLGFSPTTEYLFATASGDKTIGIWDIRNVKDKVHTLEGHNDAVTSLSWHPTEPGIIGTGSYDRRIIFWDLSKVGDEQLPDDQEDGPPELYVFSTPRLSGASRLGMRGSPNPQFSQILTLSGYSCTVVTPTTWRISPGTRTTRGWFAARQKTTYSRSGR